MALERQVEMGNCLLGCYMPSQCAPDPSRAFQQQQAWTLVVLEDTEEEFASRGESLRFALSFTSTIVSRGAATVRLLIEEASGSWTPLPAGEFVGGKPIG